MDNNLFTTSSADEANHSEDCKQGQKIHRKIINQARYPANSYPWFADICFTCLSDFPTPSHVGILWHGVLQKL